jgi:hypothetical protein
VITFLTALSGLAWTIVYLEAVRLGLSQRTYAIPVAALALNIAWESIYSVWGLATDPGLQAAINLVWALADLAIVYTFVRYGRAELPSFVTRGLFLCGGLGLLATAYVVQWAFVVEFGFAQGARYSAFLQNLLMSGLFIAMFLGRQGLRGQSMTIAVAKWIGTAAPTIVFGVHEGSAFIVMIGAACFVLDVAYIALIGWARRHPGAVVGSPDGEGKAGSDDVTRVPTPRTARLRSRRPPTTPSGSTPAAR